MVRDLQWIQNVEFQRIENGWRTHTVALNVSPAPRVSTTPPGGGNAGLMTRPCNWSIQILMCLPMQSMYRREHISVTENDDRMSVILESGRQVLNKKRSHLLEIPSCSPTLSPGNHLFWLVLSTLPQQKNFRSQKCKRERRDQGSAFSKFWSELWDRRLHISTSMPFSHVLVKKRKRLDSDNFTFETKTTSANGMKSSKFLPTFSTSTETLTEFSFAR